MAAGAMAETTAGPGKWTELNDNKSAAVSHEIAAFPFAGLQTLSGDQAIAEASGNHLHSGSELFGAAHRLPVLFIQPLL